MKQCLLCKYPVFSKNLCLNHWKKQYGKPIKKITIKEKEKKKNKIEYTKKQFDLFLEIWNEREHKSEISGIPLKEPLSIYFHHILPKRKYKKAALDKNNIILLTWDEHDNVEKNPLKYDKINKMREELLKIYE